MPCYDAGAGVITVHVETGPFGQSALGQVAKSTEGTNRPILGAGICPGTPLEALLPFLELVDIVYVLGVNPGTGHGLIPSTLHRLERVGEMLKGVSRPIRLAFDGGVTLGNFADIEALGPEVVVSGSALFADGNLEDNLTRMFGSATPEGTRAVDEKAE